MDGEEAEVLSARLPLSAETRETLAEIEDLSTRVSTEESYILTIAPTSSTGMHIAALLATVTIPDCPLKRPEAEVDTVMDPLTRGWRLRCRHAPPHCWNFNGDPIPCT